jgi:hypothetical protein
MRLLRFESLQEFMALPVGQYPSRLTIYDEAGQPLTEDRFPGLLALKGITTGGLVARYKFQRHRRRTWTLLKSQPVFNEAGQVVIAVNIVQDITGLKQSELAQRLLAEAGALPPTRTWISTRLEGMTQLVVPRYGRQLRHRSFGRRWRTAALTVRHSDPEKVQWVGCLSALHRPGSTRRPMRLSAPASPNLSLTHPGDARGCDGSRLRRSFTGWLRSPRWSYL